MQYIGSLEAAEKHISAEIFKENLHTSVKILEICMDLQDSVQRSLQKPAEKILQICTDLQNRKENLGGVGRRPRITNTKKRLRSKFG